MAVGLHLLSSSGHTQARAAAETCFGKLALVAKYSNLRESSYSVVFRIKLRGNAQTDRKSSNRLFLDMHVNPLLSSDRALGVGFTW